MLGFRCEALILLGPDARAHELAALAKQVPAVAIGRTGEVAGLDVVRTDDVRGMAAVVDHLVGLGHRRIVHLGGGRRESAAERRRGYEAAMRRHRLSEARRTIPGGDTELDGATAAGLLLAELDASPSTAPTAVAAFNDRCAVGVLDRLRRNGIAVPDQISVTGYDDSAVARLATVDLTTVSQAPSEQARLAVTAVVQRLAGGGRSGPGTTVLAPRLVVRGSTGPVPGR
jgi:DNA-binding LacI/PurR family transcriptional regulator